MRVDASVVAKVRPDGTIEGWPRLTINRKKDSSSTCPPISNLHQAVEQLLDDISILPEMIGASTRDETIQLEVRVLVRSASNEPD